MLWCPESKWTDWCNDCPIFVNFHFFQFTTFLLFSISVISANMIIKGAPGYFDSYRHNWAPANISLFVKLSLLKQNFRMDIISHYLIWLMKTSIIASGKLMSNRVGLMQISHLLWWHLCPTGLTRPHRTLNSTTFEALSSQQMAQIWSHHQNRNYHLHHEFWKHPE